MALQPNNRDPHHYVLKLTHQLRDICLVLSTATMHPLTQSERYDPASPIGRKAECGDRRNKNIQTDWGAGD
eukprot:7949651-Pyramimonas_sp.AAC.1